MKASQAKRALISACYSAGHSRNTRKIYSYWLGDYMAHLSDGRARDLQSYLDVIANPPRALHPKSVRQAVNALVFFHKRVLDRDPGKLSFARVKKGSQRRMPTVLSHRECLALLAGLPRVPLLQAALLYGCGLRVEECLQLRLKDIDLELGMLTVHGGKGDKDRTLRLPDSARGAFAEQIERCRRQWRTDHAAGWHCPDDSPSLMRKLGRGTFGTLPWYWLFPSRVTRGEARWHATSHAISKAIKKAAVEAGITKRVSPHALRHSYATELLLSCVDIRSIQLQLGHARLETTEIYTHAAGMRSAASPLDAPLENIIPLPVAASAPAPPALTLLGGHGGRDRSIKMRRPDLASAPRAARRIGRG